MRLFSVFFSILCLLLLFCQRQSAIWSSCCAISMAWLRGTCGNDAKQHSYILHLCTSTYSEHNNNSNSSSSISWVCRILAMQCTSGHIPTNILRVRAEEGESVCVCEMALNEHMKSIPFKWLWLLWFFRNFCFAKHWNCFLLIAVVAAAASRSVMCTTIFRSRCTALYAIL